MSLSPCLTALTTAQDGAFTMAQARACGYSYAEIHELRQRRVLVSLRRGVYADAAAVGVLDPLERHRLDALALALVLRQPALFSHVTAGAWLGLGMLAPDLGLLHVTRGQQKASRLEAGVHHHAAEVPDGQRTTVRGHVLTSPARTAVDIARESTFARGVAAMDSALRTGVDPDELRGVFLSCATWPGARTASRAVAFADGRAANPGESLSRVVLVAQGLPPADLQHCLGDEDVAVGATDFYWPDERTVGEFDGKLKYKVPPGADPDEAGEVVWREKRREDDLRDLGVEVVRWVWDDLRRPVHLAARIRRAFARGGVRRAG